MENSPILNITKCIDCPALRLWPRAMKKGFESDLIFLLQKLKLKAKPFMNKLSFNYTSNAKSISSFAGLKIYDDLIHKFEIRKLFGLFFPKKKRWSDAPVGISFTLVCWDLLLVLNALTTLIFTVKILYFFSSLIYLSAKDIHLGAPFKE